MSPINTPDETSLFRSLAEGNVDKVRTLVAANPALLGAYDYRNFGATPLTTVCFTARPKLVDLLLDLGADPDQKSDWHMGPWSPLHCAIHRRDHRLAQKLLERGATMDAHTAAGIGDCDRLKRLITDDPHCVHARGGDGCMPLHFADTVQAADLLLKYGADINARCVDHYSTPVQYLCKDRPAVAAHLLSLGATADIFSTVLCSDLPRLTHMLNDNTVLANSRVNQTFFPPSVEHNVYNILTFIVGQEATPLHAAAVGNCAETIPMLIAAGALVNARGGYDMATPLHLAAWNDNVEVAAALLDHGAELNARSGRLHNNSPAGWSIVAGADRVFELLLQRGAEIYDWFRDDAIDACAGRFDQVRTVPSETRKSILSRLDQLSAN